MTDFCKNNGGTQNKRHECILIADMKQNKTKASSPSVSPTVVVYMQYFKSHCKNPNLIDYNLPETHANIALYQPTAP